MKKFIDKYESGGLPGLKKLPYKLREQIYAYENHKMTISPWPFYNMVFHKSILFLSGQKKLARWLIKKLNPAGALSAKIRSCL